MKTVELGGEEDMIPENVAPLAEIESVEIELEELAPPPQNLLARPALTASPRT